MRSPGNVSEETFEEGEILEDNLIETVLDATSLKSRVSECRQEDVPSNKDKRNVNCGGREEQNPICNMGEKNAIENDGEYRRGDHHHMSASLRLRCEHGSRNQDQKEKSSPDSRNKQENLKVLTSHTEEGRDYHHSRSGRSLHKSYERGHESHPHFRSDSYYNEKYPKHSHHGHHSSKSAYKNKSYKSSSRHSSNHDSCHDYGDKNKIRPIKHENTRTQSGKHNYKRARQENAPEKHQRKENTLKEVSLDWKEDNSFESGEEMYSPINEKNSLDDEENLIEERRKRRLEILMKHDKAAVKTKDEAQNSDAVVSLNQNDVLLNIEVQAGTVDKSEAADNAIFRVCPRVDGTVFPQKISDGIKLTTNTVDENGFKHIENNHEAKIEAQEVITEAHKATIELQDTTIEAQDIVALNRDLHWNETIGDDMFVFESSNTPESNKNKMKEKEGGEDDESHNRSAKESLILHQNIDNMALMDNWDDSEGYYNPIVGEKLNNRYLVVKLLGKGVFSSVVLTNDELDNGREVAVKIIRNNETMYRAGMKELSILKNLMDADPKGKKHIIRLLGHFEYRNHLCLVFENLCMNLRDVLKEFGKDVGLNIKAVRVYAQQLLIALSLLKRCNILHADIKPDNILVSRTMNTLKLCDLGSAMEVSDSEMTPYLVSRFYRAPEIILGLPHKPSLDIWSVACTLYELYTGKFLFSGRSNNQMLKLMMDLKGKFPNKVLRKGIFTHKYFDEDLNFMQTEIDKVTGKEIKRKVVITRPTKDLRTLLEKTHPGFNDFHNSGKTEEKSEAEVTLLSQFIDFLDKALHLNPEKRITVREAFLQPFINMSFVN